ncbi:MAG: O-methyltransferase [Acidobacteriota bacterium]|nr:O-methyltransferase [Acidobacteriota bacterium]
MPDASPTAGSAGPEAGGQEAWNAVEELICEALLEDDPALEGALANAAAAGMPPISVSPNQGKMLGLLARAISARAILELGTLAAYSTIWLARALSPGGRLVTIEADPAYAAIAGQNIAAAGLEAAVELRTGDAHDVLAELIAGSAGPYDLIFIDADKKSTPEYFRAALDLSHPGSLIVVDNVVRGGSVLGEPGGSGGGGDGVGAGGSGPREASGGAGAGGGADDDAMIRGIRGFYELARSYRSPGGLRVSATAIPTVGSKGFDGFALALVHEVAAGA